MTDTATLCPESYGVTATWAELFKLLPGYDPISTAKDCHFDASVADGVFDFFETQITHVEGELAGQPFVLQPWQKAIMGCAFGWFRPNGTRRYRRVFQYVPRKNGKTTQLAALLLLVANCDGEPGAQLYSAAADREQATLIYRQASAMIAANPRLAKNSRTYRSTKVIDFGGMTIYRALSSDSETKHGFNSHFVIIDELHAHYNRDLVDVLETSTGARRQSLIWYITTADYDRESICNEQYEYACRVRDGVVSDHAYLPIIFEAAQDADYLDPEVWRKANPNFGISITEEYMAREAQRASDIPSYRNTFKRLHLNIRTQTASVGIDLGRWDACKGTIDYAAIAGRKAWIGLDLAGSRDTTAAVLCIPPVEPDGIYTVLTKIWIPKGTAIERNKTDGVDYLQWQEAGHIKFTEGFYKSSTDYTQIIADLGEWFASYNVRAVVGDPWNADMLLQQVAQSHTGCEVLKQNQTHYAIHRHVVEFEKLYMNGRLLHDGNPCVRWQASNVVRSEKEGKCRFTKAATNKRIDVMVAMVMGVAGAMQRPNDAEEFKSNYESAGLTFA